MISFNCPKCGHHYDADDQFAGATASCDECQQVFIVPDGRLRMRCPHCQTKHAIPREYIGKVIRCNKCSNSVHVAAPTERPDATMHVPPVQPEDIDPKDDTEIDGEPAPWDDALSHIKASALKQTFYYRFRVLMHGEEKVAVVEATTERDARDLLRERAVVIEKSLGPDLDPHAGDIPLEDIPDRFTADLIRTRDRLDTENGDPSAPAAERPAEPAPTDPHPAYPQPKPRSAAATESGPESVTQTETSNGAEVEPPAAGSADATPTRPIETFTFRALDPYNNRVTIEIEAKSPDEAKLRLLGQNYHSIEPVREKAGAAAV